MQLQKLIKFIESHSQVVLSHTETTITVDAVYSKDGQSFSVPETIAADLGAVRDWLGY